MTQSALLNSDDKHPPPPPPVHHHHHAPPHHHQTPKDNKLLNYEAKLHKRKSIPGGGGGGRVKSVDRVGQYSTNNNRRNKVSDLVKKRGPKPKLRMFGSGRVHVRTKNVYWIVYFYHFLQNFTNPIFNCREHQRTHFHQREKSRSEWRTE